MKEGAKIDHGAERAEWVPVGMCPDARPIGELDAELVGRLGVAHEIAFIDVEEAQQIDQMGGMVASPTPTVPISGDSMTVMAQPVPGSARASMLAAIQPAVPPPTMAMRLIRLLSLCAYPTAGPRWRAHRRLAIGAATGAKGDRRGGSLKGS
jgi:hypothetical protein